MKEHEACGVGLKGQQCKHNFEFDSQAGVTQCAKCGYIKRLSTAKKYGWNK